MLWEKSVRCSLWDITADRARRIQYLDTAAGAQNASLNTNDTTVFAWPSSGGVFTEYDLQDAHIDGVWKGDGSDTGVAAVSPDGRYLASYSKSGMTSVFDRLGDTRLWSVRGTNSQANVLAFSPSGRFVASGGVERTVDVWDAHTGCRVAMLSGSTGTIFFVTILQGDRHLAAACGDGTMRCWDIASGRLLWAVQTTQSTNLQQTPDGSRLLTTSQSGVVSLWDAETGDRLLKINSAGRASDARFSPDGSTLELSNSVGGYANYAADMRPHDVPSAQSVSP